MAGLTPYRAAGAFLHGTGRNLASSAAKKISRNRRQAAQKRYQTITSDAYEPQTFEDWNKDTSFSIGETSGREAYEKHKQVGLSKGWLAPGRGGRLTRQNPDTVPAATQAEALADPTDVPPVETPSISNAKAVAAQTLAQNPSTAAAVAPTVQAMQQAEVGDSKSRNRRMALEALRVRRLF